MCCELALVVVKFFRTFFAHIDKLIVCRFLLKGIERQVAQFGVRTHAVVEADEIVRDVIHGFAVIGAIALPDTLRAN